ncbi:MAG: hemerythrin domain-containing protein [Ectothiorhodospiraceae bacterium]|nr:hemerythrin domain-containing protein [Ectothiorhodospiraceae bacterium]MCH8504183.1 hemerythrin domain-containing protein [Ectothiorhodospiraceae bacterium]
MTLFEALREDHQKQRTLLDLLVRTEGHTEAREELFVRIRKELEKHAAAEERTLYVPMMAFDMTQEKARHGVAEHHEIDELVAELADTDFSSPGWLVAAKKLQELVQHHLDEEEHEVFQLAGRVLDEGQKESLAKDYLREMQAAQ